jgi:hypothetical protein
LQFLAEDRTSKLKLLAKEERQTETISDPAEENRWTLLPREQWKVAQRGDITQYCSSDCLGCDEMPKNMSKFSLTKECQTEANQANKEILI